jgi:hypothetical protein
LDKVALHPPGVWLHRAKNLYSRVWNLYIFSVSKWDTRIQNLVPPLPENPVSHFWILVTGTCTISIISHPIQISFHNTHCYKLQ